MQSIETTKLNDDETTKTKRSRSEISEINRYLAVLSLAQTNALSSANIQAALASYGFGRNKLEQGQQLCTTLRACQRAQEVAYGTARAATERLVATEAELRAVYSHHVKLTRLTFARERAILTMLGLDGVQQQSRIGLISQATQFYTNALADNTIKDRLLVYSVTQAQLETGLQQVRGLAAHHAEHTMLRSEARDTTKLRDAAFEALQEWSREFCQVVRWAARKQPHLLDALNIRALNPKRRAAKRADSAAEAE